MGRGLDVGGGGGETSQQLCQVTAPRPQSPLLDSGYSIQEGKQLCQARQFDGGAPIGVVQPTTSAPPPH